MNWYLEVLKKYTVFTGRARRKEYWMFVLVNLIILVVLWQISEVLYFIYALAVLIPGVAVSIRRLHDTDRSGWWILLSFIPLIGQIIYLVFTIHDSTPGENKYGPNPKGITSSFTTSSPNPPQAPVVTEAVVEKPQDEVVINDIPTAPQDDIVVAPEILEEKN